MGGARQTDRRADPLAISEGRVPDPCGCAFCEAVVRDARRQRGERGALPLDLEGRDRAVDRCHACGHFVPDDVLELVRAGDFARGYRVCGLCSPCPTCGRCAPDELLWYADFKGTPYACHHCRPLCESEKYPVLRATWNRDPDTAPCWLCGGVEFDENGGEHAIDLGASGEKG